MRKRMLKSVSLLVVMAVMLAFLAAGFVMYERLKDSICQGIRDEAEYIRTAVEVIGDSYLTDRVGNITGSRITLVDENGDVLYDSEEDPETMENHGDRPEYLEAREKGFSETVRFSETLSKQTFYYALRLDGGQVLRVAKTTDSVFKTMLSGSALLVLVLLLVLIFTIFLVSLQTARLVEPINELDLEHPLNNVVYEEMRPLMMRLDAQNRQIAEQMEELKKAGEVRREFSANVSHELKTPLMSISGYAEIMENGMVRPADIQEFAGRIHHEASRLTTLVEDIIVLSKLDEDNGEMPFETVDIAALTRDVLTNLEHQARKKDIWLTYTGCESLCIHGVHHLLYELFFNLADNAVKYTKEGGMVRVRVDESDKGAVFSVVDNGIGIAAEEQERIFERFYRVDKSHSRETGGTGLGLSIVKHAALLHGAKINLDSEVGKGTRIEVTFPKKEK